MVKNPPYNAGDMGSILGQGTKIPHAMGQLSPHAATTELMPWSLHATTREEKTHTPQLERSLWAEQRACAPQPRPDAAKNK